MPGPTFRTERVLIVGLTPFTKRLMAEIQARPRRSRLVGVVIDEVPEAASHASGFPLLGPFSRLPDFVANLRPHRVVVAVGERRGRTPVRELLEFCVPRRVIVEEAAEFYERLTTKLAIESLTPTSIVFSNRFRPSRFHHAFARTLSVSTAIVGLVVLFPVLLLIGLAIKLDSRGPVLFIQDRIGAGGRSFKLVKFRTMRTTYEPSSEWARDNGHRLTRAGKWLRVLRLDELPQFINIVRGEMNLVGPRPHPLSNLELFTLVTRNLNEVSGTAIQYYPLRSLVPPGLTGWAQVRYGYANNLEEEIEKLRFDLYYVKHASPWLDLRILAATPKVLFSIHLGDGVRRPGPAPSVGPAPSGLPPRSLAKAKSIAGS
jgi:lipopolysaccharide/colanic/teichoic acid biosynthesis glycosyltransferase